jgi:hypothetical protein
MGEFGGKTLKPSWIYSNAPWIGELNLFKTTSRPTEPSNLAVTYYNSAGQKKFCGTKELKASQAYPSGFGRAVSLLYEKHRDTLEEEASEMIAGLDGKNLVEHLGKATSKVSNFWVKGAALSSVFQFLTK